MTEMSHNGVEGPFSPFLGLEITLYDSVRQIGFTLNSIAGLFLLDQLWDHRADGFEVTEGRLEDTA